MNQNVPSPAQWTAAIDSNELTYLLKEAIFVKLVRESFYESEFRQTQISGD